jgi:hypothetical protein
MRSAASFDVRLRLPYASSEALERASANGRLLDAGAT